MKKCFILLLMAMLCQNGFSQFFVCGDYSNDSCDGCTDPFLKSNDTTTQYFPYGGVFTPKGDIRALIVFASFGGIFDTMSLGNNWPANSNFPNWAINPDAKAFYTDTTEFWANNIYGDTNMNSVSNYYYQMSKGKFRLMADYYPQKIVIPDSLYFDSWAEINAYVLSQIPAAYNWSKYDNRKNNPKYKYDNSISQPDSVIDYIVFCYRFSTSWTVKPYNFSDMVNKKTTAHSHINIDTFTQNPNYRVKDGITTYEGATKPIGVFVHELGHNLYGAKHYNGGNGVTGKYFYMPSTGWGMMTAQVFTCPLAWERWLLSWSEITASGINSDISSQTDLALQDTFILRDYITTGDAIRIKIPNGNGEAQHLWIENHQGKSIFDADSYNGEFCHSPISKKKGIGMYVEAVESNRNRLASKWILKCNGIRYIHADGNYNFGFNKTPIHPYAGYCENPTYNMYKNASNPIGGQNVGEYIRHDYDNDGKIVYGGKNCDAIYNEKTPVIVMAGDSTADYMFGKGLLFDVGAKIDRSTNPTITNLPQYISDNKKMEAFYLNGISVEIVRQYANGDICLKIRLDDIDINKNTTYSAAQIVLPNTTNDSNPDLRVLPNVKLTISKSKTPNRESVPQTVTYATTYFDTFVSPTVFTCDSFSFFKQEPKSTVEVKDNSTLILSTSSTYEIGDGAKLIIDSAATIWLRSNSVLRIKGTGRLEIRKGAYICLAQSSIGEQYIPGATVDLQDTLSSLCLRNGYNIGSNPNNEIDSISNCSSNLIKRNYGCGKARTYNDTAFIQDTIFYGKHYISGKVIKAGHHITTSKPFGDVIIRNGSYVIFDAEKDVLLDNGFEVEQNGKLEIIK
ncbi:MAG: hypothetical protein IKQ94_10255 [Bacteroidales bacterium]|nr:hypothetical protein [Bacteroidales bacterium]